MDKAHIIAEAGVNHNGQIEHAYRLIDIAAKSGADSVKFQIINPYGLYLPGDYAYGHYDIKEVIKNRFSTVLSDDQYLALNEYASSKHILFSSSVFDPQGLDLLDSMNPPYIKIASSDLTNIRFLRQVAEKGKKMILSTGMASLQEIETSLNVLHKSNFTNIVLLHCVSIYPCPLEKSNVAFITTLREAFGYEVGYSDHTRSAHAAVAAYCLGARWFEKHFTFDNELPGFDHKHAQNEEEFTEYIKTIRAFETSINPSDQKLTEAEKYTSERARRSLYAAKTLRPGDIIKDEDVLCVRPSGILNANDIDLIVGQRVARSIDQYSPFSLDDISNN